LRFLNFLGAGNHNNPKIRILSKNHDLEAFLFRPSHHSNTTRHNDMTSSLASSSLNFSFKDQTKFKKLSVAGRTPLLSSTEDIPDNLPAKIKIAIIASRRHKRRLVALTCALPRSDNFSELSIMEKHAIVDEEMEQLRGLPVVSEVPELSN
jgi:hypothetical protein